MKVIIEPAVIRTHGTNLGIIIPRIVATRTVFETVVVV